MSAHNQYKMFLYGMLSDGRVTRQEREAVEIYTKQHGVTPDSHAKALAELGKYLLIE